MGGGGGGWGQGGGTPSGSATDISKVIIGMDGHKF